MLIPRERCGTIHAREVNDKSARGSKSTKLPPCARPGGSGGACQPKADEGRGARPKKRKKSNYLRKKPSGKDAGAQRGRKGEKKPPPAKATR